MIGLFRQDDARAKDSCLRSLMNIRARLAPIDQAFLQVQDEYLQELRRRTVTRLADADPHSGPGLYLWQRRYNHASL
ncbi:MAG: hypothetical protein ACLUE8_00690 [Lachnospiraceae bacterium]